MEASFILARINKAREFKFTRGAITFDLVCPSELDLRRSYARAARDVGGLNTNIAAHYMVMAAVRGWSGVTVADVDPDAPTDEKPQGVQFDPDLLEYWLARDSALTDALATECFVRVGKKAKAAEDAKKN